LFSIVDQDLGKLLIFFILYINQDFPGQQWASIFQKWKFGCHRCKILPNVFLLGSLVQFSV